MADWTERYRPTTLAEVRGNDKARDALREWAESWEDHREAVILHGAPGIGKTSAAHALANDMEWPTIELNASDSRTKDVIEKVAGEAAKSGTLTAGGAGRRLVVMDEADNIHGNADRGGARAITSLVKEANQPMILIANEFYEMSNGLRNACDDIEFRDVGKRSIVPVLRDVLRQEEIAFDDEALTEIAEMNDGDLRGAIKDLQALAEGRDHLAADDVVTGERDTTEGIFDYLDLLLKEAGPQEALEASYDVDETPDDLINWIEDNMPKEYAGSELTTAYEFLANADRWLGRVRAKQNYSFWRYAGDNMTAGVAAAREGTKGGWTRYGPPSYWSKLGRSKGTRNTRDHIAQQIAAVNGVSMRTARREIMPFLATMTHHCKNRELTVAMAAQYEMDASHVAFVTGSGKDTNKVQSIVEDAEELREEAAVEGSDGAFEGASAGETTQDATGTDDTHDDTDDGGQATLGGEPAGDDGEADDSDGSQESDDGDQQSGLSDFM
ncbi:MULTISPECIES: replication factor C large subunit [Halomicrobium]|uniref:Replication factor C large subunit n=2 Tax=Halomicrobium mukohataei TaxID=57705 RepID=C7P449_HALMD|nr:MULTISPECIES: replication factor C large subunit [Halomicrobium]ACV47871.1 AAA ATPase central domain protein [Halomicrobium mukohataei DSM 12286]QCD66312.1 replication factor C large subunit [Halomicrobium mukohataei]QFR21118.1 replication factor C large subunit [Halomicrobium sp. ZPS1]